MKRLEVSCAVRRIYICVVRRQKVKKMRRKRRKLEKWNTEGYEERKNIQSVFFLNLNEGVL